MAYRHFALKLSYLNILAGPEKALYVRWHTSISKDMSGFMSNNLLIRISILLWFIQFTELIKVMRRMVRWNIKYEMKYLIQNEMCEVWDNAAIAYFLIMLQTIYFGKVKAIVKREVLMCHYFNYYWIDLRSDETFEQYSFVSSWTFTNGVMKWLGFNFLCHIRLRP